MATLYEGYTLCGLVKSANSSDSGIHGIELEGDTDHVVVTDSARSVTLYKVSLADRCSHRPRSAGGTRHTRADGDGAPKTAATTPRCGL